MRRDLVFAALFIVIVLFFLFFFIQAGPSSEPEDGTTPATGTTESASGTSSSEPPLRSLPTDGSVGAPDSGESQTRPEGDKKGAEKAKSDERDGSSAPAGLDHVVETIDFESADMADVFAALEAESGLKFYAPEHLLRGGDTMKVTLRASKITVRSVIELVVLTKRLTWEARPDGTIHIAEGD